MTEVLVGIGFEVCICGQCLFRKEGKEGVVLILLYVDDAVIVGTINDIKETFKMIRESGLNITTEGKLNDFLGCSILRQPGVENECWMIQSHLVRKQKKVTW